MEFATPLIPAQLIRRYKRFLADAVLDDGREVTAHCPNPGAMLGLAAPGARIWLEPNDDPKKKLKYGWRLTELAGGHLAGIDTSVPNRVVGEALRAGQIDGLSGDVRAEVPYGTNSRVDFTVGGTFVEVKNVHLRREGDWAEFPDCETKRGLKHLEELTRVVQDGGRAVMLYLVQRTDCSRFRLAADLDPAYARGFDAARDSGVEVLCYGTEITTAGVSIGARLSVDSGPQSA